MNTTNPLPRWVFPVLTTERLVLREFQPEDAPAVFEMLRREEVNRYMETDTMTTLEEAQERVRTRRGLFESRLGIRWALALRENPGRLIGSAGMYSIRRGTGTVEMGYDLHPDYWNRGLMTEALTGLIGYCFSKQALLPVHRIEALVYPTNLASIRVLEKLGFVREGVRREFGFWKGVYQDVVLYALLNSG